jgi:hypothetical protein
MNDGYLRNREGRIIAKYDGAILRDGTGRIVAKYDDWDARTRERSGRIVGNGDLRLFQLGKDHPDK